MTTPQLIAGATSTLRRRIYAKIRRPFGARGCWTWDGAKATKRDGAKRPCIRVGGRGSRMLHVARVLLVLRDRVPLVEREQERLEAGHTCHNSWCVNPRHLVWQTRIENEASKYEFDQFSEFSRVVDVLAAEAAEPAAGARPAATADVC